MDTRNEGWQRGSAPPSTPKDAAAHKADLMIGYTAAAVSSEVREPSHSRMRSCVACASQAGRWMPLHLRWVIAASCLVLMFAVVMLDAPARDTVLCRAAPLSRTERVSVHRHVHTPQLRLSGARVRSLSAAVDARLRLMYAHIRTYAEMGPPTERGAFAAAAPQMRPPPREDVDTVLRVCAHGQFAVVRAASWRSEVVQRLLPHACVVLLLSDADDAQDFVLPEARGTEPLGVFSLLEAGGNDTGLSDPVRVRVNAREDFFRDLVEAAADTPAGAQAYERALFVEGHAGSKLRGYVYAVALAHAAQLHKPAHPRTVTDTQKDNVRIWDWDTRTLPCINFTGVAFPSTAPRFAVRNASCACVNVWSRLGAAPGAWPRGLPLTYAKTTSASCAYTLRPDESTSDVAIFAVQQDEAADVDGVYKQSRAWPFYFTREGNALPAATLQAGTFAPFNDRSTVFGYDAQWALLLPVTVHPRVSDVWRSYIAQRLMADTSLRVGFMAPSVTRIWQPSDDAHAAMADFFAEQQLHAQVETLVQTLARWESSKTTLPARFLALMSDLYTHGFIDEQDVDLAIVWMQLLIELRYPFPRTSVGKSLVAAHRDRCLSRAARDLTFWTSDLHDGSRVDLPATLNGLGYRFVLAGHKGETLAYPDVAKHLLFEFYAAQLCGPPATHQSMNNHLSETDMRATFDCYRTDPQMARTDAIVCTFPSSFCESWMALNRTLIWWTIHRYGMARCTTERWTRLTQHVVAAHDRGHVIAAANVYDAEYIHHYTGLPPLVVPGTSLWYVSMYHAHFSMARPEILIGPLQLRNSGHAEHLTAIANGTFTFAYAKALYGRFQLQDIANHRAVVIFPYAVMSWGLTELYALGMPMFVPHRDVLAQRGPLGDRRMLDSYYCPNMTIPDPHAASSHAYDPESDEYPHLMYWLRYADFYTWPHVTTFRDEQDLLAKLAVTEFQAVHDAMMRENARRRAEVERKWRDIACEVSHRPSVPASYEEALTRLWGVTRLQVE